MKILNEPIGTWISIAAFLISLSTLFLALRKQKHDERTALASKIAEIKTFYGEQLRIIVEILEKNDSLADLITKSLPKKESNKYIKYLSKNHTALVDMKSRVERIYSHLGKEEPKTSDPLVLYAIAVESDGMKKILEKQAKSIEDMARSIEAIINKKPKARKPLKLKVQDKKRSKK